MVDSIIGVPFTVCPRSSGSGRGSGSESTRFGGAANVANNIRSLGGTPYLVGLIGDDYPGSQFAEMVKSQGLDTSGIIVDSNRPTTIKTRVSRRDSMSSVSIMNRSGIVRRILR